MFVLGTASKEVYDTLHDDLKKIVDLALKVSHVDFSLIEGYRPIDEQFELYKKGRVEIDGKWHIVNKSKIVTYIDGINKKSKHNYNPSLAVDVAVYVKGHPELIYDEKHMIAIGGAIMAAANMLYNEGKIKSKLRWGADFNNDHELIYDQSFVDLPHFELIHYKDDK